MNIEQALKILGVSINDNFEDIDIRWRELVTSESLKQQDSLITVEQLNDKLILLNTARELLKDEGRNLFKQHELKQTTPQSTSSVNVVDEATRESNTNNESLEKGLSENLPLEVNRLRPLVINSMQVSLYLMAF